jgi:phage terminase large subunit
MLASYEIRSVRDKAEYVPYGGALEMMYAHDHELILAGPAETGKTLACCWKAHILASKYPGCQGAIVRKTQKSVYGSVIQTYERVIQGAPISPYGGEKPEKYLYANGSVVWVGGMDNPDKVLSSERDFIYVNQPEELNEAEWELLLTRATGRSAVIPYPQVFGDPNPGGSKHWIRERARQGKLRLITSVHRDNPTLYDPGTGEITEQGKRTMAVLNNLTGVRRKRLLEGIWATSEGAVYDMFDATIHVRERDAKEMQRWMLAMDEGYTNPAVILLIGIDGDGRLHIAREYYRRGTLQKDVVAEARKWANESKAYLVAVDQSAAGLIADLKDAGLPADGHKGRVLDGITAVQGYLRVQDDGRPRLTVDPSCVETINEFESYVWKPEKDEPVKEYDHALDALRYGIMTAQYIMISAPSQPEQKSRWTQHETEAVAGSRWKKYQ